MTDLQALQKYIHLYDRKTNFLQDLILLHFNLVSYPLPLHFILVYLFKSKAMLYYIKG